MVLRTTEVGSLHMQLTQDQNWDQDQ